MIADIGIIGALYTFVRLLQSLTENRTSEGRRYPTAVFVITIIAMLLIALLAIDIAAPSTQVGVGD